MARHRRTDREQGYIAMVTAIVMLVLLMFAGMAIDVGYWYARSSQLQRAADAAALAGATLAPKLSDEITIANQTLERNNITAGPDMDVTVAPVPNRPRQLKVTVRDKDVPAFFTRLFRGSEQIERSSTAEYIQDISLGSAFNAIGTGPLLGHLPSSDPNAKQNFWLAISGFCTQKEDGDRISSQWDGGRHELSVAYVCDSSNDPAAPDPANGYVNTDYDPAGYAYTVHVPCPGTPDGEPCPTGVVTSSPVTVEVYDGEFNPSDPSDPLDTRIDRRTLANWTHWAWWYVWMTTTFDVYQVDNTPDDVSDDVLLPGAHAVFGSCSYYCAPSGWVPIASIPVGSRPGDYRVQVHTGANEWTSFGTNQFALRARIGGSWSACTSISGQVGYRSDCPSVSGRESMGVFADKSGSSSDMFLARLSPAATYRGKRVRILLWDPGEGGKTIQILPPGSSTPTQFTYKSWFPGLKRPGAPDPISDKALGWSSRLVDDKLDVSGSTPLTGTYGGVSYPQWALDSRYSQFKFNDRMVAIEVSIPRDYGLDGTGRPIALPDDGWWKIRYNSDTGVVQDRTTWTVTLAGDPVHLVDG